MPIIESKDVVNGEEISIYIEVDKLPAKKSPYEDTRSVDTEKIVEATRDAFGDAMRLTRGCAKRVVDSVQKMEQAIRPEEFEVKMAIKLDSEIGAVIAKASAGAQIEVTMRWKPKNQS